MITLDSHCDTPMFFDQGINFATRDKKILVDLHKMTEGHLDATIMVAYLKQLERTDEALSAATAKADRILNEIEEMVAKNCTAVDIAYTPADLCRLKKAGKKAVMLGIENGYAIGGGTGMYVWRIPAQERRSYHQGCHRASEPHGKCHGHRTCRDRNRF